MEKIDAIKYVLAQTDADLNNDNAVRAIRSIMENDKLLTYRDLDLLLGKHD